MAWQTSIAPEGVVLLTKIDDAKGERNMQPLKRQGNLWWHPDGGMYVYYHPTHWRHLSEAEAQTEQRKIMDRARAEYAAKVHAATKVRP